MWWMLWNHLLRWNRLLEENISDDDIKNYGTCLKHSLCRLQRGSKNSATSKMELFLTIDKGFISDMTRFLDLSLDYVTILFIGWFNVKNILHY